MFDRIRVAQRLRTYEDADELSGYSKVVINVSDDMYYEAGTDTGRTLTLSNPWGTQRMADDILAQIRGIKYKPYKGTGVILDPAAELGDAVDINGNYGGLYSIETRFGGLLTATISAPGEEEMDEEYPYKTTLERKIERQYAEAKSTFKVQSDLIAAEVSAREVQGAQLLASLDLQATQISAKVSKTGGSPSSFGWVLDDSSWTIKANSTDILKATKNGLEVYGKITATSGKIGGFTIESDYLSYNNQTWGGTNSTGIYWGPSGIQCGPANKGVQMTPTGYLYAENGYFRGSVNAGSIQYGGDNGTLSGSALTSRSVGGSQIGSGVISTTHTSGGINSSLGYADYSNGVFNGWNQAEVVYCKSIKIGNTRFAPITLYYKNQNGGNSSIVVLAPS